MIAGTLEIQLLANMARLQQDMNQAKSTVSNAMAGIERAAASAKMALGAIGAGLSVAALAGQVRQAVDQLAKLDDMAQKTGSSVENLSKLAKVAAATGQEFGAVDAALIKLAKGMGSVDDSTNRVNQALRGLGVSAKDSFGKLRDPSLVMVDIANSLQKYRDGASKTALAQDAMGKSGAELLPYLNDVSGLMSRFSSDSKASAEGASKFLDMLSMMRVRAGEVSSSFAVELLPVLNRISDAFEDSKSSAVSFGSAAKVISTVLEAVVILGSEVAYVFRAMGTEIGGIAAQMAALSKLDFAGFKAIGKAMKEDAAAARIEHDKFIAAVINGRKAVAAPGVVQQDLDYQSGTQAKAAAAKISDYQRLTQEIAKLTAEQQKRLALGRELTPAEKRLADLIAERASGAKKLTDKEFELAKAQMAGLESLEKQVAANEKLKKVREELAQIVTNAETANDDRISRLELENSLVGKSVLQQQLLRNEYESNLALKRQFAEIDKATKGVTDPAAVAKLRAESSARIQAIKDEAKARIEAKYLSDVNSVIQARKNPVMAQFAGERLMPEEVARRTALAQAEHAAALSKIADLDAIRGRIEIEAKLKADIAASDAVYDDKRRQEQVGRAAREIETEEKIRLFREENAKRSIDGEFGERRKDEEEYIRSVTNLLNDKYLNEQRGFEMTRGNAEISRQMLTAEAEAKLNMLGMSANQLAFDNANLKLQQDLLDIQRDAVDKDEQLKLGLASRIGMQGELIEFLAKKKNLDLSQVGSGEELVAINKELLRLKTAINSLDTGAAAKAKIQADADKARLEVERILAETEGKNAIEKAKADLDSFFDPTKAQTFGETLRASFGTAGDALSRLTHLMQEYGIEQAKIDKAKASAMVAYGKDPIKLAEISDRLLQKEVKTRLGAYGDMANAAKGFFAEGSKGYRTLDAAAKIYHSVQMALQVKEMAQGAIAAVINQAKGDPYTAWARMAAMAAAMAALGFAVSGGGGGSGGSANTAADRQKAQGAGTVFGDSTAQSESIKNAIEELSKVEKIGLTYARSMLDALNSIRDNIKGMVNAISASTGLVGGPQDTKGLGLGAKPGLLGFSFLGGSSTTLVDQGIAFGKQSVEDVRNNGVNASAYSEINKTKNGFLGFGASSRNSTSFAPLDERVKKQMSLVVMSIADGVEKAGEALGMGGQDLHDRIMKANIDLGLISLKGLSGQALTDALNGVFSKYADTLSAEVLPGFAEFQQAGEGYYQTLVRTAVTNDYVKNTLDKLGLSTGLVGMESIRANMHLADLAGGLEKFARISELYTENFYSEAERAAMTWNDLDKEFKKLGISAPRSRAEFRAIVDGLDLTTEAGRKTHVTLMELNPVFASVTESTDDLNKALQETIALQNRRDNLEIRYNTLQGNSARALMLTRNLERASTEESNRALLELVYGQEDYNASLDRSKKAVTEAFAGIQRAVGRERDVVTKAYQASLDRVATSVSNVTAAVDKLKSLSAALRQSVAGIIPPSRAQAQAQIMAALAIAKAGGGLPSAESLSGALQSISEPSEKLFSTFVEWQTDQKITANNIAALADISDAQITVQDRQLLELEATRKVLEGTQAETMSRLDGILTRGEMQIAGMNAVETSVFSVATAVDSMTDAVNAFLQVLNKEPGFVGNESQGTGTGPGGTYSFEDQYRDRGWLGGTASNDSTFGKTGSGVAGTTGGGSAAFVQAWSLFNGVPINTKAEPVGYEEYLRLITRNKPDQYHIPPGFASGGFHSGGMRVVGENGPELEFTGPSRIHSNSDSKKLLNNDEVVAVVRELIETVKAGDIAIAKSAAETAKYAKRWDGNGILVRAETTNPLPVRQTA